MKEKTSLSQRVILVALSVLLIFTVVFSFTGSWFTDNSTLEGIIDKPVLQPTVEEKVDNSYQDIEVYYWNTADDNKNIYIHFDLGENNVRYQLARVFVTVDWGTIENGVFTPKSLPPIQALALQPNYSSSWVAGDNDITVNSVLADNGITDDMLDNMASSIGITRQEAIESIAGQINVNLPRYYYNGVIDLSIAENEFIEVFNGFTFDSINFSQSEFEQLTARVSISVDADSVSDRVIGEYGYWVYNQEVDQPFVDRPKDVWLEYIRNQKTLIDNA